MLHTLFPVYVREFTYTGETLEKIQQEVEQEYAIQKDIGFIHVTKEENPRVGSLYTTSGAFDDVNNFVNDDSKFPTLKNEILKQIKEYCNQTNIKPEFEPFIRSSWFAITHNGNSSSIHTHLWEDLVAVYYYKADGDEGNIKLHSPHNKIKYTNDSEFEIVPKIGKFLIFPGWLGHDVLINNTDKERVSVAVNVKVFKEYEYNRP